MTAIKIELERRPADAVRLWSAVASAHAALDGLLDGDPACPVLGSDAFAVLLPLAQAPDGRMRMHELAERSHLTPSGLTRRIDRLVEDGLVVRDRCGTDRRGAFAVLSPRGLDELGRALPHHTDVLARAISERLEPDAVDRLVDDLESVGAARR
jgi:DNA-binding MarR family transcriptional regulator